MSYPPYPPGPGNYPYPPSNPYPNPPIATGNYGFATDVYSGTPSHPVPPMSQVPQYGYPSNPVPYPGASNAQQPASYGSLPYPPQPPQASAGTCLSYPTQSYSSLPNTYNPPQSQFYPNLSANTTAAYSSQPSVPPPSASSTYGSPYPTVPQPQKSYPTSHSPVPLAQSTYNKMYASGTVREHQPFSPEEDAKVLRKAMKGLGTDEKAIIAVLSRRTNAQRQQILITYKTHFGRDLIKDLKSELSGHLEDVIVALMTPTAYFLAQQLHKATSGLGTDETAIIEILCPLSNHEVREVNAAYYQLFHKPLEKHLIEDTSGHFRRLLVSLCMGNRNENPSVDHAKAMQDANALYQAGEAHWGTDESIFNSILVSQSFPQLQAVFAEYQKLTGKRIQQSIKNEFSGDIERGLLAIVKCAENVSAYFAERLYHSMAGAGTDDRSLIRIITTRCEIDMVLIKQEFQRMFGKSLDSFIAGDTSGDYKRVLLALVQ
uniref:Annexin n=1 Tax=Scolopendra viridis TaxID=118503 RepID=A0A4D5R9Q8_SCOVI